ncbi:hypothetical protein J5491_03330 [Candidatus Saccharibacteria bacterium]|nr:hypothetical protein [Candidatus Saccharibacteria bacterium]
MVNLGFTLSLIAGFAVAILTCATYLYFYGRSLHASKAVTVVICSLLFGAVTFLSQRFAPDYGEAAIAGTIALCLIEGHFCYLACKEASKWSEILLLILTFIFVAAGAINAAGFIPNVSSLVIALPRAFSAIMAGCFLLNYFVYHSKGQHLTQKIGKAKRRRYTVAAVASIVLAIALAAALVVPALSKTSVVKADPTDDPDASNNSAVIYHFYNDDLQSDEDATNNYNFGPSGPLDTKKAQKNHAKRLKKDTVLLAAAMGWVDANTKTTQFLKKYYDSCNGDWEKAMNKAAKAFYKNPELYDKSAKKFIKFLKSADKVFVRDCLNYSSQMYMRPRSNSKGLPEIIALETLLSGGHELVYVFNIDGKSIEVRFRIECGYQPVDVVKVMHIKPQPQPDIDPTNPDIDPTNPNIDPTKPGFNKDPNEAPTKNTEPNDDPGPGKQTEENKDPNSSDKMTYPEYVKEIDDLKDINKNQKKAGDPNTPSIPKPTEDTVVDNNGDYGYGWGGADDPTTGVPTAKTEDGTEINTEPAGRWGGPTD